MKKVLAAVLLSAALCATAVQPADTALLRYVNPFIGTTNFGTTNPGALVPNGLMSVTPFNVTGSDSNRYDKDARWWSTPYDVTNSYLTGFSHVNLSGVGCPELGSVVTMATSGPLDVDYRNYGTTYSREAASPGYYTASYDKYDILAEATATARTSVERYTFPAGQGNILVNLGIGLTNETGASIRRISDTEIAGSRLMGTFCYNPDAVFTMYFALRVNKKPSSSGFWKKQPVMHGVEAEWTPDNGKYKIYRSYGRELSGDDIGYWFTYDSLKAGEQVEVSVAVSFVSEENAIENLDSEQHGTAFADVLSQARDQWARLLGRIEVEGGTDEQRTVFYTALYHTLIHPNILQDVNGQYPKMESGENGVTERDRYTVFSLWDTYRNLHQLLTLVYPEKQSDMVNSMVEMYREWGWLPKWELYGRETFTMEGDPAIPVIVDTWRKGLRDYDMDLAYEAMKKSATLCGKENRMRPDIDPYIERGYIPLGMYQGDNSGDNSVSHALEYYVADNALAWLAEQRGDKDFARQLRERSKGYRHYYSKESGTLRPINQDGTFLTPFDPRQGENFEPVPGFHEGSAWNYTFFVPHDVDGLIRLMGGRKEFVRKLQSVFDRGLYDPANEPDIAYPYLFTRIKGEEYRTHAEVADLLQKYFTNAPDGIPGNDDAGTMSAWAVFSMMGFYPDCPGVPEYALTLPLFDKVTIHLNPDYYDADTLTIEKSPTDRMSIRLGDRECGYRISHDDLIKGRSLKFGVPARR
ncbi:MAG: GH92 family glycosyl hydrolase [Muribaculaceae bacterium]|nr:GH92 family glycosyl hydrolase [Muribaculaceae bacterium]